MLAESRADLTLVQPRLESDQLVQQVVRELEEQVRVRVVNWPLPVHSESDTINGLAARAARLSSLGLFKPVLVCFGGLFITSVRGFPGLRTQEVVRQIGADGIIRLLAGGTDRSARWIVILAYCRPGEPPAVFQRVLTGEIPLEPIGDSNFLDAVFVRGDSRASDLPRPNPIMDSIGAACREFLTWLSPPGVGSPVVDTFDR